MAAPRNPGPDDTELRRWFDEGHTHKRMAEMAEEKYHWPWTANAIAVRLNRMGLTRKTLARHDYTVPWTVSEEHAMDEVVVNLRRLGRKIQGLELKPRDEKRLDRFLRGLVEENVVIHYSPTGGFLRIDRATVPERYLHPDPRVPILLPESKQLELAKRRQEALKADSAKTGRRLAALQGASESRRAG